MANISANLSYCGLLVPNVQLKPTFSEFKNQFLSEFSLGNQLSEKDLKEKDAITLYYIKDNEKKFINNDEDYKNMLDNLNLNKDDKKKSTIFIETKIIPVHFDGPQSIEFEDEIKKVVERELLIAANNIKKCLTSNLTLSNSKKVRKEICQTCKRQIIGFLYKKIAPIDDDNIYYCELCSMKEDSPLFKIN